jgi:hypothetical protein
MDATLLLPTAALRAPTGVSVVQSYATSLLSHAHLIVVRDTRPCAWKAVNDAVPSSSLERKLCLVTGSVGHLGYHHLRLQRLVEFLDLLLRPSLLFKSFH